MSQPTHIPWGLIGLSRLFQAKFYQTNRQARNWGRRSGAKSLEVAMCCRSGQEGEQSEGNPADTRQSKKRLTRMLIGSKNCCKYPTSIQIIPSKPFSARAPPGHFLAYSYATGALYVIMCLYWSTGRQWWQYFSFFTQPFEATLGCYLYTTVPMISCCWVF